MAAADAWKNGCGRRDRVQDAAYTNLLPETAVSLGLIGKAGSREGKCSPSATLWLSARPAVGCFGRDEKQN